MFCQNILANFTIVLSTFLIFELHNYFVICNAVFISEWYILHKNSDRGCFSNNFARGDSDYQQALKSIA